MLMFLQIFALYYELQQSTYHTHTECTLIYLASFSRGWIHVKGTNLTVHCRQSDPRKGQRAVTRKPPVSSYTIKKKEKKSARLMHVQKHPCKKEYLLLTCCSAAHCEILLEEETLLCYELSICIVKKLIRKIMLKLTEITWVILSTGSTFSCCHFPFFRGKKLIGSKRWREKKTMKQKPVQGS